MRDISLNLNGVPRDYEFALEEAMEAMREYWDTSGEAKALIKELFDAFRLAD